MAELAQIARLDARIGLVDARGWFDDEIRQTWPPWSVERYLGNARVHPARARSATVSWLRPRSSWAAGRFPSISGPGRRGCGFINARPGRATCGVGICGAAMSSSPRRAAMATRGQWPSTSWCFLHFARGLHRAYRDQQRAALRARDLSTHPDRRQDRVSSARAGSVRRSGP